MVGELPECKPLCFIITGNLSVSEEIFPCRQTLNYTEAFGSQVFNSCQSCLLVKIIQRGNMKQVVIVIILIITVQRLPGKIVLYYIQNLLAILILILLFIEVMKNCN